MLKTIAKTLPIFFLMISFGAFSQKGEIAQDNLKQRIIYVPDYKIVCQAGTKDMERVPLPKEIRNRINSRIKTADFEVNYIGFSQEAKDAFQYAVDIWASLISSSVPIRIDATYKVLENENTLGQTSPGAFITNFKNAPKVNTWFQMPIAEKIAGEELNDPSDSDIEIEFNSTANWYFDINNPDSIAGTGKTDFATVVLHELGHALGFSAFTSMDGDNGDITVGTLNLPMTYTRFIQTLSGQNLVNDITDESKAMGDALTSGALRFKGPTTSVRVYAPEEFSPGSSISHTDQLIGELMNPFLGPNGYIHDPGRALGMMQDYGWTFTYMIHEPFENTEDFDQDFVVSAEVFADDGYDTTSLKLYYSLDGFLSDTTIVEMLPTGEPNIFSATIPAQNGGAIFSYFITAVDNNNRIFTNPGEAPDKAFFGFVAATDDSIPTISHTPLDFLLPAETKLDISASISDFFTGVDTAYVKWFINDVEQEAVSMTQDSVYMSGWKATLNFSSPFQGGDILKYQIIATDKAKDPQTAIGPSETGFYTIAVEGVPDAAISYESDFNEPNSDWLGTQFSIYTPSGFNDGALNSPHPYAEAGEGNEINYIAQLKVPIVIDPDNSIMTFDEIVLVEFGDAGGFYDYVVVEASKDQGETWRSLVAKYDCTDNLTWESQYGNNANSTAEGIPNLYKQRTINLDNAFFNPEDTISIRFRLYSDPFAVGWGWAIDNLKIQGEVTAITDNLNANKLNIYPNPSVDGHFRIEAELRKSIPMVQMTVMDMMGRIIQSREFLSTGEKFTKELDLGGQPPGIYFVNTFIGDDHITTKVIKSN